MVTDGAGCMASETLVISGTPAVTATVNSNDVSCDGTNDGSATVTTNSGTGPFTYLWSDGQTTPTAINLTAGSYTVVITDAVGCTVTETAVVGQIPPVTATITPTDVDCGAVDNGTATAIPSGGTAPFFYQWSNNAVAPAIAGLTAGTYMVTITDAGGCSVVESVTINDPNLVLAVNASQVVVDLYVTGTVDFTDNTPGATSWDWDFGDGMGTSTAQNPSYTYTETGTYTVTVTVSNGICSEETTIDITVVDNTPPPSSVEDIKGLATFDIYPNPTSGLFNINLNLANRTDISIRVVNTIGQVLIADELGEVQGELMKAYDLRKFAHGMYFVTITDGTGTATKRLFYNW